MTPYEVVYGHAPPVLLPSTPSSSPVEEVDMVLRKWHQILHLLQDNLHMARARMKQQANQHRFERTFQVGDMVFLCLQHYKQSSNKDKGHQTLAPKISSPYLVLQKIGYVAYKLALPPSRIQQVIGANISAQIVLPEWDSEGSIISKSEAILNKRTCQLLSRSITKVFNSVAQPATRGCHMGTTPWDLQQFSPPKIWGQSFSKREGMLRTRVNLPLYFVTIFYWTHMLCKSSC